MERRFENLIECATWTDNSCDPRLHRLPYSQTITNAGIRKRDCEFVTVQKVHETGNADMLKKTDDDSFRAYSKRVFRTNCALRIKKYAPRISSGIYFLSTS